VHWTAKAQGWTSIAAVLVAVGAAALAGVGVQLQAHANDRQSQAIEDQINANNLVREQKQREYAVRVSWWVVFRDGGKNADLKIQNRSTVPISKVAFKIKRTYLDTSATNPDDPVIDSKQWQLVPVLPPCSILTLQPPAPLQLTTLFQVGPSEITDLHFTDAHGGWTVTSGGEPTKATQQDGPTAYLSGATDQSEFHPEPLSDCGNG
jgi:hypothetical protein